MLYNRYSMTELTESSEKAAVLESHSQQVVSKRIVQNTKSLNVSSAVGRKNHIETLASYKPFNDNLRSTPRNTRTIVKERTWTLPVGVLRIRSYVRTYSLPSRNNSSG